jgi:hypothetical protein
MYYSSLAIALLPNRAGIDIGVAKSTNGGRSWSTPTIASASLGDCFGSGDSSFCFYFADKDALTVGPAAGAKAKDVLYDSWDDFPCDQVNCYSGVPVARSSDGGQTWQVSYADKIPSFSVQCDPNTGQCANCTVQQYIGAAPSVDPKDGTLYVAIEKIMQVDTTCSGSVTTQFAEMIFKSTDGGQTFGPGVKIADVTSAVNGLLELAPGKYMRDLELPTVALTNNALYVAWNDGASGSSHIRLAKSTDGGQTWSLSWATQGSNDELQPALSSDNAGLHLLYYQRNNDNTLDVLVANSQNGNGFVARRVTSVSFPGALTFPNFDPLIAWGYMGDYIANVSDGTHQYFAWGDNRNMVKTVLYPQGRNDPDVYFAKQ